MRQHDTDLMALEQLGVVQQQEGHGGRARQIGPEVTEHGLIVLGVTRDGDAERRGLCASSGTSGALLVVGDARRDVEVDHGLQITQIDAHFHRGRATEHIDLAAREILLDLLAQFGRE